MPSDKPETVAQRGKREEATAKKEMAEIIAADQAEKEAYDTSANLIRASAENQGVRGVLVQLRFNPDRYSETVQINGQRFEWGSRYLVTPGEAETLRAMGVLTD